MGLILDFGFLPFGFLPFEFPLTPHPSLSRSLAPSSLSPLRRPRFPKIRIQGQPAIDIKGLPGDISRFIRS